MTPAELEQVYETLAVTLDRFDAATGEVFLAKLALVMAQRIGDPAAVQGCIADAAASLDG